MSVTGVVLGVSPDWRGSDLTAATTTGTTVLSVVDAVDFDEDGGWLVIADETTPRQYVAVDFDADTVTLAAAVGAVFEEDLPVSIWDATVVDGGARVVEYVAQVDLDGEAGTADAIVPHAVVPTSGVDFLIGATVALTEVADDDSETPEWEVSEIIGRESKVDSSVLRTPFIRVYLPANVAVAHATAHNLAGLTVSTSTLISAPDASGWMTVEQAGIYLVIVSGAWAPNNSGARYTIVQSRTPAGVVTTDRQVAIASSTMNTIVTQATVALPLAAGAAIRGQVQQTSGGVLDLAGASDGRLTGIEIVRQAVE